MVSRYSGISVKWCHGEVVSQYNGVLVLRYHGVTGISVLATQNNVGFRMLKEEHSITKSCHKCSKD